MKTFLIMLARLPERDAKPIEDASYDRWIEKALEATVGGAPSVEKSRIVTTGLGTGRETTFEATVEGKAMRGRLRAFASERNLVMAAFVAAGEEGAQNAAGLAFLESLAEVAPNADRDELHAAPVASTK